ncbi:hypothetical protein ANCDUO_23093 [Ancylostoma duodenale]|uniref:Uncharacterized protein n=1 Tax=Ancylostoma duodenale TaxID=51022 RepID=A0A0C2CAM5_9BILA|nr:hypothetical protein ANCDUO_23093 [Ancylostoma duodenale]
MAHCALPDLTFWVARSKVVNDMFELANIASISEEECWSNSDKERELRMKNSQYLSPYGIAIAMDAHRKRCPEYAKAINVAKGERFEHSAVFPWPVRYDLGAYVTTAISMLDYVQVPGGPPNPNLRVFIALPHSFAKVNAEVDYDEAVTMYVYDEWSTLAKKLMETQHTPSIIIAWPDKMPESRAMRQLLIALERHLQTGGTLMFFPSPFEDNNEQEWRAMADTCAEFVRYLTDPSRRFEALVRDHYSGVRDSAPYTHPAGCLGTEPRFKKSPFSGRQILLYLEKMRLTINDVIKIKEFDFASAEVKERRRKEKLLKAKRRREEHMPNFYVIQDPERRRHDMNITFRAPHERRRNSSPTMRRPHGDQAKRDCRSHSPTRSGDHQNRAGCSSREARIRDEQRSSRRPDDQRHTSRHEDEPRTSSHRPDDPRSHSHRRDDKVMRAGKENPRK